jgi:biopolymer transport protein ExbB
MLERSMTTFALLGAEWVLWLLVVLSVLSVAVMVERGIFYARRRINVQALSLELDALLQKNDVTGAKALLATHDAMPSQVVVRGLEHIDRGQFVVSEMMAGELVRQKGRFESRLIFLGTLGNNAPFIGLFGTVLGIIRAFRDLALDNPEKAAGGAQAVMAGISEALVATAVGLAVALPAVVAFNYFKSVVKGDVANTETLTRVLTAHMGGSSERS